MGAWLAAFPLLHNATETCEGAFCGFASVVRGIGLLLPGMVQPWLSAYESHPGKFILLVALFTALLWIGGYIQQRIKDGMRAIWEPIINSPSSVVWPGNPPHDRLYRLRTHPWYQTVCRVLRKGVLPTVAGLLFIVLLLAGLNKGLFAMMSAGGVVCPATASKKLTQGTQQKGQFPSASLCWSTGVEVTQGKRYRITLVIDDKDEWKDGSYPSSINGLESDDVGFVISLGLLLRRHLSQPWFKPIARIGHQGSDEYPLEPVDYPVPDESPLKLVSEITARRSGALYLFVNDAVLPVSKNWQIFYRNNAGIAKVTVEPVEDTTPVAITWAPPLAAEDL